MKNILWGKVHSQNVLKNVITKCNNIYNYKLKYLHNNVSHNAYIKIASAFF